MNWNEYIHESSIISPKDVNKILDSIKNAKSINDLVVPLENFIVDGDNFSKSQVSSIIKSFIERKDLVTRTVTADNVRPGDFVKWRGKDNRLKDNRVYKVNKNTVKIKPLDDNGMAYDMLLPKTQVLAYEAG